MVLYSKLISHVCIGAPDPARVCALVFGVAALYVAAVDVAAAYVAAYVVAAYVAAYVAAVYVAAVIGRCERVHHRRCDRQGMPRCSLMPR